jgi:hypothetical protein
MRATGLTICKSFLARDLTPARKRRRFGGMALALENYMQAAQLPESQRKLLRVQAKHAISHCGLNGEDLGHPFGGKNLFDVIGQMKRYVVDGNSPWKQEASKPENCDKAFVAGETALEEPDNLKGQLFSRHIDVCNDNLFIFGLNGLLSVPVYELARFDEYHWAIYNHKSLDDDSQPRTGRVDAIERQHMFNVQHLREFILGILELRFEDLTRLPPPAITEPKKAALLQRVRDFAPFTFKNHRASYEVATMCYAALLLERDEIGRKTRREFQDLTNRNVFGDTRLIQNALWLAANLFSYDKAVGRMVQYLNLPEVSKVERFENPFLRVLSFRLLKICKLPWHTIRRIRGWRARRLTARAAA